MVSELRMVFSDIFDLLQLQVSQTGFVTCKSDLVADISENVLRIVTCDYHKSLNENEKN